MNDLFNELIRCAVSDGVPFSSAPGAAEWAALLKDAAKQSVVGVTFPVVDRIPIESGLPLGVYSRWALMDEKIRQNYTLTVSRAQELCGMLEQAGFRHCILKGIGTAGYYHDPSRRQSGDIDIWIEGDRKDIVSFLRSRWTVKDVVYHHCEADIFPDVKVEVHFTPSWMNGPFANRKLQKYYRSCFEKQSRNLDEGLGVSVPTIEFSAVHCIVHIYRHILHEGVGLRQFMDMYFILENLSESGRSEVRETLEKLGLRRCTEAVMYVLQDLFGLEEERLLYKPDEKNGQFIMNEVSLSGNFGKFDRRNKTVYGKSLLRRAAIRMSRLARFAGFAPLEVFFAPGFKAWQFIWKKQFDD